MDDLRALLGIKCIYITPNVQMRKLWGVLKGVDARIDETVLRLLGYIERIGNHMAAKRM